MINDRQRVEMTLLPMMMLGVVLNGVTDLAHPDAKKTQVALKVAAAEGLKGLMPNDAKKIMRRVKRADDAAVEAYRKEGTRVDKVGLLVFYLLQMVTESDYLILTQGSAMSEAMDLVIPALTPSAEIEKLNESAKKAAKKALKTLQEMGYFEGVTNSLT